MRIILYILTVNQRCYTWKFHIYEVTNQTFHFDFKNLSYLKPASWDDEALEEEAVGNDEEDGVGEFVKSMTLLSSSCQRRVMSLFLKSHKIGHSLRSSSIQRTEVSGNHNFWKI